MNGWSAAASLAVVALVSRGASAAEAMEHAKAASITPIEPSPHDPHRPAYRLYVEYDLPALGIGVAFAAARLVRTQKAWCAPLCDKGPLNPLDRLTAGRWHPKWGTVSDVSVYSLGGAAVAFLLLAEPPLDAINDLAVVAESALLASSTATIMTVGAARPRPYLYGENAPLEERNSPDASMSFISSHTAVAFAISTSTWRTYQRLYPDSKAHWAVLAVGDAAATLVGMARLLAGKHFATDVIAGAVVGTSVGVLVPAMHSSPVQVVPTAGKDHAGLSIVGAF